MATYTKIGRIRPDYADVWDSARSYTALEVVKSADSYQAYIAKQDVPASTPLTDEAYWGVVLDVSDVIAESVAATNRANTAAEQADAAREAIKGDFEELSERTDQLSEEIADIGVVRKKTNEAIDGATSTNIFDGNITRGRYIGTDGTEGIAGNLCYTNKLYPVVEGETIVAGYSDGTISIMRFVTAYDAEKNVLESSGVEGPYKYTVPAGVAFVRFSLYLSDVDSGTFRINKNQTLLPYEPHYLPYGYTELTERINSITEDSASSNVFDGNVTRGRYVNTEGAIGTYDVLCYTNSYYPVQENDKFIAGTEETTQAQLRYVTAYDADKNVMSSSGMDGGYLYTVPAGVAFVRFSFYLSDVDSGTFRLNKSAFLLPYEPHEPTEVPKGYDALKDIEEQPLSTLPEYMLNCMAYRPLGQLSKAYICLVSDDSDDDMVTYSIPMVESKGVPCTWAIMSTSEIFKGDNVAEKVAAVVDSVANHRCAIAQHGSVNWTEYTEKDLNEFFDRENAFMASYGLEAKCAVAPSHYISPLTCAVAGGKYGVVRAGFYGENPHTGNTCEELVKAYPNYTCGARTNVFALSSQNLAGISQSQAKAAIDYAKENNLLVIFYWHENSLDDALKARIEDAIDYAKEQGIEFITLDQVATVT